MTIEPRSYSSILDDANAPDLLAEYAVECAMPELGEAKPQREIYEMMEKSGGFHAFGVYDEGTLVGFASVAVYVLPHYGKKIAATESIYITPGYPGSGKKLTEFIEDDARQQGCHSFFYTAPLGSRFARVLARRLRHTNNVYIKVL